MQLPVSFFALMVSVAFLQLSSGGISPLDALSGLQVGFTSTQVGLLGSAHFVGFFIGCWWSPRLMGTVGHARAFATFAACGAIGAIAHPLWFDPWFWTLLRVMTGLCIAGCYTIIEAWLHASVTNATRGRALGSYRVVDLSMSMLAQMLIGVLPAASYMSYNLLAIVCCAALFPLMVSRARQPSTPETPRLKPLQTFRLSPLGVAGVVVAGVTTASFRMVGPVYGQQVGLGAGETGLFLAAFVFGGAVAQLPIGWLADVYDRRWVLIWLSLAALFACVLTVLFGTRNVVWVFSTAAFFGLVTFPIFSVASAHANDFAKADSVIEISASLMFWYGIGAIASPLLASYLIDSFGPTALFVFISVAHVALALFGLKRMLARPSASERTPYRYLPRTSFTLGRLFRRRSH
ncbi:MAG: MFS transporter [Pseudomonadota bacterium]